jgi:hypothetical protein
MPIQDLSENIRIPRLGKIHLGIRHPEKNYPMKTDYFVLPKDHSDYAKMVKLFGEKPKKLRVLIPSEDIEDWAPQYYKAYNMTYGLVCRGDGNTALRMADVKDGELPRTPKDKTEYATSKVNMIDIPCPGKNCKYYQDKKCGEVMNLRVIIPELPGLGIWQIDTGSINSILNINSCAKLIKNAFGRIRNIPLELTLEPINVNNPENGKKQTVFVLNLRTEVTLAQLADEAREQSKQFQIEGPDMAVLEEAFNVKVRNDEALWTDGKPSNKETSKDSPPAETPQQTGGDAPPEPKENEQEGKANPPSDVKDERQITKSEHNALLDLISMKGLGATAIGDIVANKIKITMPSSGKLSDLKKYQYDLLMEHLKKL